MNVPTRAESDGEVDLELRLRVPDEGWDSKRDSTRERSWNSDFATSFTPPTSTATATWAPKVNAAEGIASTSTGIGTMKDISDIVTVPVPALSSPDEPTSMSDGMGMGTPRHRHRHRRVWEDGVKESRGSNGDGLASSLGFESLDGFGYDATNTHAHTNVDTHLSPYSPDSASPHNHFLYTRTIAHNSDTTTTNHSARCSSSSSSSSSLSRSSSTRSYSGIFTKLTHPLSTYTPTLHRWAARANLKALREITLAHVLSGDTCDPIGLSEFEAFLAFRDYSLENLQFIVWFQDYRERFNKLPEEVRRLSPSPLASSSSSSSAAHTSTLNSRGGDVELGDANREREKVRNARSRARLLDSIKRYAANVVVPSSKLKLKMPPMPLSAKTATTATTTTIESSKMGPEESVFGGMQNRAMESMGLPRPMTELHSDSYYPPLSPLSPSSSTAPLNGPHGDGPSASANADRGYVDVVADTDLQPFREECMHVLATFVSPRAKRELLLDSKTKDEMMKSLVQTTHPDIFLPAYEFIYTLIETVSLPRFLAFSTVNINSPKQLYWYALGALFTFISIVVALGIVLGVSVPGPMDESTGKAQARRAWRLFAVLPGFLGVTFVYSAWRGFCSRLFDRHTTQLRVWEMEGLDEDTVRFYSGFLPAPRAFPDPDEDGGGTLERERNSKIVIAPFDVPEEDSEEERKEDVKGEAEKGTLKQNHKHKHKHKRERERKRKSSTAPAGSSSNYKRPPIFGPEKVVRDARILEVHKRVLIDIWKVGLIYVVIASAILLCVPNLHP